MQCSACSHAAITYIRYNGRHLCAEHFIEFVEKRVKREVRKQGFPRGVIAVALSGGKDSIVCCYLLSEFAKRDRGHMIYAITIDEGICGYRSETILLAERFCKEHDIPHHIVSFKDVFKFTLDEVSGVRGTISECTYCGVFRRHCLNNAAKKIGASVLSLGHNLDDISQTILMNFARGDMARMARMAPHKKTQPGLIPRILPLRTIPEKEVALYALLKGFPVNEHECPYAIRALRGIYRDIIMTLESAHPGSRHSILKSYLEIDECLKIIFKPDLITSCERCFQSSSESVCMVCQLIETIQNKFKEEHI